VRAVTWLLASSETTTCTVPEMPCCAAIGGVSGSMARIVAAGTFGRAHESGVGVGLGVGAAVAGAAVAGGAVEGAAVPWPCGMPWVLPVWYLLASSVGPVLVFDSVLTVLILILGCCGAGVFGGGVDFGGGVGGGVGCGVGVGGGVGGGVGTRTTVTFFRLVFLHLRPFELHERSEGKMQRDRDREAVEQEVLRRSRLLTGGCGSIWRAI